MSNSEPAYLPQSYSVQWVTLGESFHHILARLRKQRGLSQSRLAQAAQVSIATAQRAEDEAFKVPSVRIAIALFRALNAAAKVGVVDALAYARAAEIDAKVLDPTGALDRLQSAGDQLKAIAPVLQKWNDAISSLPQEWQEPTRRMAAIVDHIGPQRMLDMLFGIAVAEGIVGSTAEASVNQGRTAVVEKDSDSQQKTSRVAARGSVSHGKENEGRKRSG